MEENNIIFKKKKRRRNKQQNNLSGNTVNKAIKMETVSREVYTGAEYPTLLKEEISGIAVYQKSHSGASYEMYTKRMQVQNVGNVNDPSVSLMHIDRFFNESEDSKQGPDVLNEFCTKEREFITPSKVYEKTSTQASYDVIKDDNILPAIGSAKNSRNEKSVSRVTIEDSELLQEDNQQLQDKKDLINFNRKQHGIEDNAVSKKVRSGKSGRKHTKIKKHATQSIEARESKDSRKDKTEEKIPEDSTFEKLSNKAIAFHPNCYICVGLWNMIQAQEIGKDLNNKEPYVRRVLEKIYNSFQRRFLGGLPNQMKKAIISNAAMVKHTHNADGTPNILTQESSYPSEKFEKENLVEPILQDDVTEKFSPKSLGVKHDSSREKNQKILSFKQSPEDRQTFISAPVESKMAKQEQEPASIISKQNKMAKQEQEPASIISKQNKMAKQEQEPASIISKQNEMTKPSLCKRICYKIKRCFTCCRSSKIVEKEQNVASDKEAFNDVNTSDDMFALSKQQLKHDVTPINPYKQQNGERKQESETLNDKTVMTASAHSKKIEYVTTISDSRQLSTPDKNSKTANQKFEPSNMTQLFNADSHMVKLPIGTEVQAEDNQIVNVNSNASDDIKPTDEVEETSQKNGCLAKMRRLFKKKS